ncbi:hypothetical protein V6N13_014326 [Hibiscus sabdariffa]
MTISIDSINDDDSSLLFRLQANVVFPHSALAPDDDSSSLIKSGFSLTSKRGSLLFLDSSYQRLLVCNNIIGITGTNRLLHLEVLLCHTSAEPVPWNNLPARLWVIWWTFTSVAMPVKRKRDNTSTSLNNDFTQEIHGYMSSKAVLQEDL